MSDVKEAFFIARGIQIDAPFDPAKKQAAEGVFGKAVAKVKHGVCFAPVFTIFPDLNRGAAHLLCQFDQARVV